MGVKMGQGFYLAQDDQYKDRCVSCTRRHIDLCQIRTHAVTLCHRPLFSSLRVAFIHTVTSAVLEEGSIRTRL